MFERLTHRSKYGAYTKIAVNESNMVYASAKESEGEEG